MLDLRRELGDRAGEANIRHMLASVDFERGEYERARGEFVELRRELGDRAGEANIRHMLARIAAASG